MVEITNRSSFGEVRYTDSDYEMTGDFRQDPSTNDVTNLNLSVNSKKGVFIGGVNGYTESGELRFSLNNIPLQKMGAVATAVENCIGEIKEQGTDNQ